MLNGLPTILKDYNLSFILVNLDFRLRRRDVTAKKKNIEQSETTNINS